MTAKYVLTAAIGFLFAGGVSANPSSCVQRLRTCVPSSAKVISNENADLVHDAVLPQSASSSWTVSGFESSSSDHRIHVWLDAFGAPTMKDGVCRLNLARVQADLICRSGKDCAVQSDSVSRMDLSRVSVPRASNEICTSLSPEEDFFSTAVSEVGDDLPRVGRAIWKVWKREKLQPSSTLKEWSAEL